jgi:ABC-2 type transport system permease protein
MPLRLELLALVRDRAAVLLLALLALLAFASTFNGTRFAAVLRAQQTTALAAQRTADADTRRLAAQLTAQPDPKLMWWDNPTTPSGFAYYKIVNYAAKPIPPAAALAIGQADLLPHLFKLNIELRDSFLTTYDYENPHRLLSGRLDFAFVVVYLLPLFVLALAFHVIAGERESGVLGLLAAQPYPLWRLALAKLALRAVLLGVALGAGALAGLATGGFDFAASGAWAGLAAAALVVALYAAGWFALVLWLVARGGRPAAVALRYAAVWLAFVVLIPAGANLLVKTLRPLPSRAEFIDTKRLAADEAGRARAKLVAQYFGDHPELAAAHAVPVDKLPWMVTRIFTMEDIEKRVRPIEEKFAARMAAQQDLLDRLKFLSPALLAQTALNDLGGSSLARHRAFLAAVDANHAALRAFFNPKILRGEKTFSDFDGWPRFTWRESAGSSLASAGPAAALLALALIITALGLRALRRGSISG